MGVMVDKKIKKHFLAFHTVFNVHENVQWLEEFLIYYINLGFTQFYLYDNTKSQGRNESRFPGWVNYKINGLNKYGFKITKKPLHLIEDIKQKYKDYITYVNWEPLDGENKVWYGYNKSVAHLIDNFSNEIEWCAFFDLDEFIFSPQNNNLINLLKTTNNTHSIILRQKKFLDRHLSSNRYITQEFKTINNPPVDFKAHKHIIKVSTYKGIKNMHTFLNKNSIRINPEQWRFNHYNSNALLIEWMNKKFNLYWDKWYNGEDTSMERYSYLFEDI